MALPIVTIDVAVAVQPATDVPVTVYVVVEPGDAVTTEPVEELNVPEGLHAYVLAPFAVKVALDPGQIVAELTVTVGKGLTVTRAVAVLTQLPEVPVTVYVVVDDGLAETLAPVVALNPVLGLQL
jgi:hypothetical protein